MYFTYLRHLFQLIVCQFFFSTTVCSNKLPIGHRTAYETMPRRILCSLKMWATFLNMTLDSRHWYASQYTSCIYQLAAAVLQFKDNETFNLNLWRDTFSFEARSLFQHVNNYCIDSCGGISHCFENQWINEQFRKKFLHFLWRLIPLVYFTMNFDNLLASFDSSPS